MNNEHTIYERDSIPKSVDLRAETILEVRIFNPYIITRPKRFHQTIFLILKKKLKKNTGLPEFKLLKVKESALHTFWLNLKFAIALSIRIYHWVAIQSVNKGIL